MLINLFKMIMFKWTSTEHRKKPKIKQLYLSGRDISTIRKSLNLTKRELAIVLSVTERTITAWECERICPNQQIVTLLYLLKNDATILTTIKSIQYRNSNEEGNCSNSAIVTKSISFRQS